MPPVKHDQGQPEKFFEGIVIPVTIAWIHVDDYFLECYFFHVLIKKEQGLNETKYKQPKKINLKIKQPSSFHLITEKQHYMIWQK
jgi:hypothetical protein